MCVSLARKLKFEIFLCLCCKLNFPGECVTRIRCFRTIQRDPRELRKLEERNVSLLYMIIGVHDASCGLSVSPGRHCSLDIEHCSWEGLSILINHGLKLRDLLIRIRCPAKSSALYLRSYMLVKYVGKEVKACKWRTCEAAS